MCAHWFNGATDAQLCCCVEVASPAQVLPAANHATIHKHWQDWAAMTASGIGCKLSTDPERNVSTWAALAWPTMFRTRDNLGVNDCMLAREEQAFACKHNIHFSNIAYTCADIAYCIYHACML